MITRREGLMLKRIDDLVGQVMALRALFDEVDLECAEVPPGRPAACAKKRGACWQCRVRRLMPAKVKP